MEQGERQGHQVPEAAPDQLRADAQEEPGPGEDPKGAHRRNGEPDGARHGHQLRLRVTNI